MCVISGKTRASFALSLDVELIRRSQQLLAWSSEPWLTLFFIFLPFISLYVSSCLSVIIEKGSRAVLSVLRAALVHDSHGKILEGLRKKEPMFVPSSSVFSFVWVTSLLPPKLGGLRPHLRGQKHKE